MFCAARKRWLITTSPVNSTRSSSTNTMVSPRVCIAAGPRHNSRTCTPPRSRRCSRSNRMSGVGYGTPLRSSLLSGRSAREGVLNGFAQLGHVLLLHARHHQLRAGERARAKRVLGVIMRRHHVDLRIAAHLLHLADDGFAVARTESGVHHQRGPAADDDADVGNEADVEIRNRPHVIRELDGGVLADQWWRRRGAGRRCLPGTRADTRPTRSGTATSTLSRRS